MIGFLQSLELRGEQTAARLTWALIGAGLVIAAAGFAAAAGVDALALAMPRYAAQAIVAVVLILIAAIAFARAHTHHSRQPRRSEVDKAFAERLAAAPGDAGLVDTINHLLTEEARASPAKAAALAALAGLIVGALDGLKKD